ncbi:hypothetical protein E1B28_003477 [Marasmius oreades]|uniref:Sulfotransferase n=1 Tax=Marasmius oreades TaxID=181124 RepID=A0A9P7RLP8_9AGAR|nr:uncharacterized protein E1B28_003477 [Marasmius oreades]KAG7085949.1 hypothetical protein E1B28_003477 [Marasmius oreades]
MEKQRPIFIFSHPRTRSNLLAHILATHPDIGDVIIYPFRAANSAGPERRLPNGSIFATKEVAVRDTFQRCYEELQGKLKETQDRGFIPLIKDHIFNSLSTSVIDSQFPGSMNDVHPVISGNTPGGPNPTVLPDTFLANITPIIVIRHPTTMVASTAKVMLREFGADRDDPGISLSCTYKWSRVLFDFFRGAGQVVGVVDGDEMVNDTEGVMIKLCGLIGVDGSLIQYEWKPKALCTPMNEEMNEHVYLKALYESTGIIRDKQKIEPLVLEDEVQKWTVEWGEDMADRLKGFVEDAMADYDYLFQFRLQ